MSQEVKKKSYIPIKEATTILGGLTDVAHVLGGVMRNTTTKSTVKFEVHCELAKKFGKLEDGSSLKTIDDELKFITVDVMGKLAQKRKEDKLNSWDDVMAVLHQTGSLEEFGEPVFRNDAKNFSDSADFKFDGGPERQKIESFKNWFKNLINDEDVLHDTKINDKLLEELGNLVSQTGATVDSFETFWYGTESAEKDYLDIGILRFPDLDNPFLKVYRIYLSVWRASTRILFHQEDSYGYKGTYNCSKFKPRESIMANILAKVKAKVVNDYNGWLDEEE